MSRDQDLRADPCVLARAGTIGGGSLAVRLHQHLIEVCSMCKAGWKQLVEEKGSLRQILVEGVLLQKPVSPPPPLTPSTPGG